MQNFMINLFQKDSSNKLNILEASQTFKILGAAISSHLISFRFLPMPGHFWTTEEKFEAEKLAAIEEKNFPIISKGKVVRAD